MMPLRWSCAVGLLLVGITGPTTADEKESAKVPQQVQQAEKALTKWLNGFKGQTQAEIRKALGAPSAESTWLFKDKKEPLLTYKIGETTNMYLSFYEGRVVLADLHLLPRSKNP